MHYAVATGVEATPLTNRAVENVRGVLDNAVKATVWRECAALTTLQAAVR